jgi:PKHD-type hydroxylase
LNLYRVLSEDEALDIVARIKQREWEQGKASTVKATGTTKRNLELLPTDPVAKEQLDRISKAIKASNIWPNQFIHRMSPPKFNRHQDGGTYGLHADAAFMGDVRTDLACTVFLTDDYEGGELQIGTTKVKAKPGCAVVYECWRPHSVLPVTKGERICAITWMQSHIKTADQRELLNMLHEVTMQVGNQEQFAKLGAVHERLVKLWSRG